MRIVSSYSILAALVLASRIQAQLDVVTDVVCGLTGAANFLSTEELTAAVQCATSGINCDSPALPLLAQTDVLGLTDGGLLGGILDPVTGLVEGLLDNLLGFYGPMDSWCTGLISNFDGVLAGLTNFNSPLNWDTSNALSMVNMFSDATSFNQPLDFLDTSKVTDLSGLLSGATSFNQPLTNLDLTSACNLTGMLAGATSFNQDLNGLLPDLTTETLCTTIPIVTDLVKDTTCEIQLDPILPLGPICQLATDLFPSPTAAAPASSPVASPTNVSPVMAPVSSPAAAPAMAPTAPVAAPAGTSPVASPVMAPAGSSPAASPVMSPAGPSPAAPAAVPTGLSPATSPASSPVSSPTTNTSPVVPSPTAPVVAPTMSPTTKRSALKPLQACMRKAFKTRKCKCRDSNKCLKRLEKACRRKFAKRGFGSAVVKRQARKAFLIRCNRKFLPP